MVEEGPPLKITIRNPHSKYRKNSRLFDIIMKDDQAYIEVKVDKDRSERMNEHYEDQSSDYAVKGTEAHALCEYLLKTALGMAATDPRSTFSHYSDEMLACAESYVAYALETLAQIRETCPDPQILIEQKLDFSEYVPEGFGTGDPLIVGDGTLYVCDYKHGSGVLVEAAGNPQLRLYGLGALLLFDGIYNIETVSMTIFQPRRSNVATEALAVRKVS